MVMKNKAAAQNSDFYDSQNNFRSRRLIRRSNKMTDHSVKPNKQPHRIVI